MDDRAKEKPSSFFCWRAGIANGGEKRKRGVKVLLLTGKRKGG